MDRTEDMKRLKGQQRIDKWRAIVVNLLKEDEK